jgi:hypothetical protein
LPTTSSRTGSFLPGQRIANLNWPKRNGNSHISSNRKRGQMEEPSGQAPQAQSTRRWLRHQVDLPIRIIALNDVRTTPIPARGNAISRAGMALRALVALVPGDSMLLQFPTSVPSQVKAVVRNRTGETLGLEFLTQLPPESEAMVRSGFPPRLAVGGSPGLRKPECNSCNPQTLYAGLRRKREELRQVQREVEALHMAITLLADDEEELSRLSPPCPSDLGSRPWPLRS